MPWLLIALTTLWEAIIVTDHRERHGMAPTVEALEAEALRLAPGDRARLVERLIASLEADPEVEEAWAPRS